MAMVLLLAHEKLAQCEDEGRKPRGLRTRRMQDPETKVGLWMQQVVFWKRVECQSTTGAQQQNSTAQPNLPPWAWTHVQLLELSQESPTNMSQVSSEQALGPDVEIACPLLTPLRERRPTTREIAVWTSPACPRDPPRGGKPFRVCTQGGARRLSSVLLFRGAVVWW